MRRLKTLYTWFDSRLQLGEPIKEMALHPSRTRPPVGFTSLGVLPLSC
jgi:hypothetical protein